MEMMKIPHTDLEVSRLVMGCMGLGGGWDSGTQLTADHERQAREFLDAAEETGAGDEKPHRHADVHCCIRALRACIEPCVGCGCRLLGRDLP